jgi:HlyD family secretion protein
MPTSETQSETKSDKKPSPASNAAPDTQKRFPWQILRRSIVPLIAIGLIAAAAFAISRPPSDTRAPRVAPPSPAQTGSNVVAATGIIEPSSEIVAIGTDVAGIVVEVFVRAGDVVGVDAPLFRIDPRTNAAALNEKAAAVETARANVAASRADIAGGQAAIARAQANSDAADASATQAQAVAETARARGAKAAAALADAQARLALFENVRDPEAISRDELDRARYAVRQARATLDETNSQTKEATQGAVVAIAQAKATRTTIAEARAALSRTNSNVAASGASAKQAQAAVTTAQVELSRLVVRAPIAGSVLVMDVRAGEYAPAGGTALIQMGVTDPLYVRVDIDEEDAQRVTSGASAEGSLRGDATKKFPLRFIRFEPLARPKQNLTGGAERVDTRVVQALYALESGPNQLSIGDVFVGQQMDVFIKGNPPPVTAPAAVPEKGKRP